MHTTGCLPTELGSTTRNSPKGCNSVSFVSTKLTTATGCCSRNFLNSKFKFTRTLESANKPTEILCLATIYNILLVYLSEVLELRRTEEKENAQERSKLPNVTHRVGRPALLRPSYLTQFSEFPGRQISRLK